MTSTPNLLVLPSCRHFESVTSPLHNLEELLEAIEDQMGEGHFEEWFQTFNESWLGKSSELEYEWHCLGCWKGNKGRTPMEEGSDKKGAFVWDPMGDALGQ